MLINAIQAAVYDSIDELNESLPEPMRIMKSDEQDTFGPAGELSSLNTLNLLMLVDERLRRGVDESFSLTERLMQDPDLELPPKLSEFIQLIMRYYQGTE